jgi:hypothetical protein
MKQSSSPPFAFLEPFHIRHLNLSLHYPILYQHTKPPHIILSCFHIPPIYPTKELGMQGSDAQQSCQIQFVNNQL